MVTLSDYSVNRRSTIYISVNCSCLLASLFLSSFMNYSRKANTVPFVRAGAHQKQQDRWFLRKSPKYYSLHVLRSISEMFRDCTLRSANSSYYMLASKSTWLGAIDIFQIKKMDKCNHIERKSLLWKRFLREMRQIRCKLIYRGFHTIRDWASQMTMFTGLNFEIKVHEFIVQVFTRF